MSAPQSSTPTLARTLGTVDLLLIVVGTVIGSGIFLTPGKVLRDTGGAVGSALTVWALGGVLSLLGALTYAELGAARPQAGGLYAYIRDAFGPFPAFLYGWTAFFVISSGSVATLAVAFSVYLQQLIHLTPLEAKLVAAAMITVVMVVNVRGVRRGADLQNWTTGIKVGALVLVSLILLIGGKGFSMPDTHWAPAAVTPAILTGAGVAMIAVLWAYEGWQYVTFAAGEARNPQRTVPLGLAVGTAGLIGVYLLANLGYVAALGAVGAANSQAIAADAVGAVIGPGSARAIALVILVSMFSAANGLTLTAPRLYYAMARDGVFFSRLADVHPRFGTPAVAIVASSLWAIVLAMSGSFEQLFTYVVFVGWIFYGLGAVAVFTYRRREPDASRPFRTPGYPLTPILFVASAAAIVLNTVITQPRSVWVALAILLAGVPGYLVWRRMGTRA